MNSANSSVLEESAPNSTQNSTTARAPRLTPQSAARTAAIRAQEIMAARLEKIRRGEPVEEQ